MKEAEKQWVSVHCDECGFKGRAYLAHYDGAVCRCGKRYWALQPKRGGPLVAFARRLLSARGVDVGFTIRGIVDSS